MGRRPSFFLSGWSESTRFFDIQHGNSPHRQQDVSIHQKTFMSFIKLWIKSVFPSENVLMTKISASKVYTCDYLQANIIALHGFTFHMLIKEYMLCYLANFLMHRNLQYVDSLNISDICLLDACVV